MQLPEQVKFIISELNKNGYEGYIVGGCVRDYLMGIPPHDYDITTSALPEEVKAIFPHTVDTGIEHGTVTVIIDKIGYELTTYRIDGEYKDNRHPEQVIFTDKLAGDLSRRDFTVNAIAYNDQRGYVDMFGGMEDIKKAIIKGVGEPSKRFQEDALRMMRALRFSAQLNFSIEENTMLALKENAQLIKNISIERIREEFFKLIISDHNERLDLLYESGMLPYFLPELKKIIDGINRKDLIGVCLDTCHLNDAGYDISNFDELLQEFDKIIGINYIKCIHINDSKNERSSHKDRHENIGFGTIGFNKLINIIYNEKLKDIPKILETPYIGDLPPYKEEIEMIKNKKFDNKLKEKIASIS